MLPNIDSPLRSADLAELLGIPQDEAADYSVQGRLNLILKLDKARKVEAGRGRGDSWLYDVSRHLKLTSALNAEMDEFIRFLHTAPNLPLSDLLQVRQAAKAMRPMEAAA
jgi:hypothetical protein